MTQPTDQFTVKNATCIAARPMSVRLHWKRTRWPSVYL